LFSKVCISESEQDQNCIPVRYIIVIDWQSTTQEKSISPYQKKIFIKITHLRKLAQSNYTMWFTVLLRWLQY